MIKKVWTAVKNGVSGFWHWRWRNYVLVLALFAAWALFLSPNTIGTQIKVRRENRELRRTRERYRQEIKHNEEMIERFRTDGDFVETYGRETYLMKADDEDIYLFMDEEP